MPGEADSGARSAPALRTLADKVNWLIDRAHPAGRGPYSNNEVADLIEKTTGEPVTYTQIWKLRNGQAHEPAEAADRGDGQDLRRAGRLLLRRSSTRRRPACSRSRWNCWP